MAVSFVMIALSHKLLVMVTYRDLLVERKHLKGRE